MEYTYCIGYGILSILPENVTKLLCFLLTLKDRHGV